MHYLSVEATIPLIIIIGFFSAVMASTLGLGGGLAAIPFITLVIGQHHNHEAKLISYVSVAALSLFSIFKYVRQKRFPDYRTSLFILVGLVPVTMVCEIFFAPWLNHESFYPYFPFIYTVIIIGAMIIVLYKDRVKLKKPLPLWSLPFWGASIGFLSGSFGLSGGVLFVPLLVIGLNKTIKEAAVGSLVLKLVCSFANVGAGLIAHQYQNFEANGVYWYLPLVILIGSFAGSQVGPLLNKNLSAKSIRTIFICVMSLLATWEFVSGFLTIYKVI